MKYRWAKLFLCLGGLAVVGARIVQWRLPPQTPQRHVQLLSVSGRLLKSAFFGPPNPRMLTMIGHTPTVQPHTSAGCDVPASPASRASVWLTRSTATVARLGELLGITPRVVKAQSSYCQGCFYGLTNYPCNGGTDCNATGGWDGQTSGIGPQNMGYFDAGRSQCGMAPPCLGAVNETFSTCVNTEVCGSPPPDPNGDDDDDDDDDDDNANP